MIRNQNSLFLALIVALAACGPTSEEDAGPQSAVESAQSGAPTNRVDIPATVRRNLGITFAGVEVRHVAQTIRIPGAFELQPLARHEYRMALPGRVQLLVDQSDQVEPGTPLFRYQSPAWPELLHEIILGEQAIDTARAEIKVGKAKLDEARNRLALARERIAALAQADFKKADLEVQATDLQASLPRLEAEVELAETRLANAERTRLHALHRAATASGISETELKSEVPSTDVGGSPVPKYLTIDWIEVRALEPGVVEALDVTDGAFVEPPATVLSTVNPEMLRFRALALQADLPKISNAGQARIVPPPTPGFPIDGGVPAAVTFGLEAHPEERTVTLIATPEATADWIRLGISAFLEVVAESTEGPALAVPRSAVVQDGLTHLVFRRDPSDPNQAIRVEADMGVSDGLWVALNSGVMRGDEVVLSGAYELKLAMQQSGAAQAGGHFHADGSFHGDH
jgi:multidrug resistance efflux pump